MNLIPLLERLFNKTVEVVDQYEMEKGASSRRYHRVQLAPHLDPNSIVVMQLPEDTMRADEVMGDAPPDELPFLNVQRYMRAADLPVPKIYLDAVDTGALLLEDLGTRTFMRQVTQVEPAALEQWYAKAVALLAQMHDALWPVPEGCQAQDRCFDYKLLRWELDHYREWGIEAHYGKALSPSVRAELDTVFDAFAQEIAELPAGFVHRDYQSRNLMIDADGGLCILDFQDAMRGPRTYDLVALLNDSYVDVPELIQQRIIEMYAAQRKLEPTTVRREFDLITVHRKLKDGGRFVNIDRVKNDPSFLPFVEKSFSRVRTALGRLTDHQELKQVLAIADPPRFG